MKSWSIIFLVTIISHLYLPVIITIPVLLFLIYKILSDLHVIGKAKFALLTLKKGKYYFKNYKGEYSKLGNEFNKFSSILEKFKLNNTYDINLFGIYYDDPKKVPLEECRAVIGIVIINDSIFKDLEEFLQAEKYKFVEIEHTSSVVSRYNLAHNSFIFFAIKQFYKCLEMKLNDEEFLKRYKISDKNKIPGVIEIYKNNMIEFYIPIVNEENFKLYKEE